MATVLDDILNKQNQQNGIKVFDPADLEHSGTKQSQAVQAAVDEDKKLVTHKQSRPEASMPSEMPQAKAQVAKPSTPTKEMAFRNNTSSVSSTNKENTQDYQSGKQYLTHTQMYEILNADKKRTDAEQEAERKRQRRNAVIAAIGDGISALSNLYFAGKGAHSAYDPKQGLSAKLQERYDKLNAEHRAREKEYRAGYLRALALDQQTENQLARLRQQQEHWEKEQEAKAAAQHKKDEQTDKKLGIDQQNADTRKQQAEDKAAGRGGYARSGGRSGVGAYTVIEKKNGKEVRRKERIPGVAGGTSASSSSNNRDYSQYKEKSKKWDKYKKH